MGLAYRLPWNGGRERKFDERCCARQQVVEADRTAGEAAEGRGQVVGRRAGGNLGGRTGAWGYAHHECLWLSWQKWPESLSLGSGSPAHVFRGSCGPAAWQACISGTTDVTTSARSGGKESAWVTGVAVGGLSHREAVAALMVSGHLISI